MALRLVSRCPSPPGWPSRLLGGALLGLAGAICPAMADYVELTRPFPFEGTTWPVGTYFPVAREGTDSWYIKATTSSPQIPKSVSALVPDYIAKGLRNGVRILYPCNFYQVWPKDPHPQASLIDERNRSYPNHTFSNAEVMRKEGDTYIIRWGVDQRVPWSMDDTLSRAPAKCIQFPPGKVFEAAYQLRPDPVRADNLTDDDYSPWSFRLALLGGLLGVLLVVRLVLFKSAR